MHVRQALRAVRDRLEHPGENRDAGVLRLGEGLLHDLAADAGDLDVHLQSGDALLRAGDLEVHVAQVVLRALDVGQDLVGSPSLTRPIAMPETGAVIGTPASISARVEPQTEPIDDEPFDSSVSETGRSLPSPPATATRPRSSRTPAKACSSRQPTRRARASPGRGAPRARQRARIPTTSLAPTTASGSPSSGSPRSPANTLSTAMASWRSP